MLKNRDTPQDITDNFKDKVGFNQELTNGDYKIEKDTELFFDSFSNNPFFIFESQVKGRRLFDDKPVKPGQNGQNIIIDRIIHPTKQAINEGWFWGSIGIELKKTGMTIGPIITQVMEQRQTLFQSKILNYNRIIPIIFAIFPCGKFGHDIHSLQENQLIFSCDYHKYNKTLKFHTLSSNILEFSKQTIKINKNWKPSTRKGHRGVKK